MEIMQHKIKTDTSSHIQGEILYLEAMLQEYQELEADPLMELKSTLETDTIDMHQAMK